MNKKRILGNILFCLTLISPMISFILVCRIGEADIFGVAGMIRYSWVMLLFIPIGILSILIAFKLKKSNEKYKKNFIISFICIPLLIIFGSYRLIFSEIVSYDANKVSIIEDKINLKLPDKIKVSTLKQDFYDISYVKINDNYSKYEFEQEIINNKLWCDKLNIQIKSLLPIDVQNESSNFDYYLFYNITNKEYNKCPNFGEYECIFIAYDCNCDKLIILDNYVINLD